MMCDIIDAAVRTGARGDKLLKLHRRDAGSPKGGKTRAVDLAAFRSLRSLPAWAKSDRIFWHSDGQDYKNFASNFAAVMRRAATFAEENGIAFRAFRFHDLRHHHAVAFLKSGGTSTTSRSGWSIR
jgi:integrase/recombinase XerD